MTCFLVLVFFFYRNHELMKEGRKPEYPEKTSGEQLQEKSHVLKLENSSLLWDLNMHSSIGGGHLLGKHTCSPFTMPCPTVVWPNSYSHVERNYEKDMTQHGHFLLGDSSAAVFESDEIALFSECFRFEYLCVHQMYEIKWCAGCSVICPPGANSAVVCCTVMRSAGMPHGKPTTM